MIEVQGKFNKAIVYTDQIEETALAQIYELCNQDFCKNSKIRIMPDVHAGAGCTIGTTMTIQDKIVPNLVGVDIGCGVTVVKFVNGTNLDLAQFDSVIRENIPSGFNVRNIAHELNNIIEYDKLACYNYVDIERAKLSIGTLGGGNHFVEIDEDEIGGQYLLIHTGSRNLGKQVAEYYQNIAYQECLLNSLSTESIIADLKRQGRNSEIQSTLETLALNKIYVDKKLAYLTGKNLDDYLNDMRIVQDFAQANRMAIVKEILFKTGILSNEVFTTVHNYIDLDNKILRKGAVSAKENEKLIIPINMRDGSLICRGKGNEEWNYSAPHGAGRLMSRREAKTNVDLKDFQNSMKGIWTTCVNENTLDESPMAYKTLDMILPNIKDTVDVISTIKPIYNFKAN